MHRAITFKGATICIFISDFQVAGSPFAENVLLTYTPVTSVPAAPPMSSQQIENSFNAINSNLDELLQLDLPKEPRQNPSTPSASERVPSNLSRKKERSIFRETPTEKLMRE